ncbi:MAG: oxidoreductase, partial [Bacteroidales bacterium]|nr:oxidoreductase [Bacteroidales bacterium]
PRDSFLIETKVKPEGVGQNGLPTSKTTTDDFLAKFNTSLLRLKQDYVDIILVHDVSNPELLNHKPLIAALSRLKREKKARFIGFSTHSNMAGVIKAASESEMWDVILTSYNFRLPNIGEMNEAIEKAASSGIGIIAMKTLAGGAFLDKEKTRPVNTTAAIKWALSNPNVHTTIPGMTTFDQLTSNLAVLKDPLLSENEKKDLISMAADPGMYCVGCNHCLDTCRLRLPVPDLMRAYMYAYGYSDGRMAYELLGSLGTGASPCVNCSSCTVKCTCNFNVKEKISDVSRLVNVPSEFIA